MNTRFVSDLWRHSCCSHCPVFYLSAFISLLGIAWALVVVKEISGMGDLRSTLEQVLVSSLATGLRWVEVVLLSLCTGSRAC